MKRALYLIAAAAGCVAAGGGVLASAMHLSYGRGVYCALGTAATVGCDATPATTTARVASAAVIVVCIPLLAAAYGSLHTRAIGKHTAKQHALTVAAVGKELDGIRQHVTKTVGDSENALHRRLDDHATLISTALKAADGPAIGGTDPAKSEGLKADGLVIPPPATKTSTRKPPATPKVTGAGRPTATNQGGQ